MELESRRPIEKIAEFVDVANQNTKALAYRMRV